jgi:hypothetical protein
VERFVGRVPDAEAAWLLKDAVDTKDSLKYFSLSCPVARRWMNSEEGIAALLLALMRAKHPGATEDDALTVSREINARLAEVLRKAAGGGEGPKAEGAAPAGGPG